MADPNRSQDLAAELTRVRQRGLADIDLQTSGRPRTALPLLETLATRSGAASTARRPERIRRLLHDGLEAYTEAGWTADAQLIRDLFFDDGRGQAIGRTPPGTRLDRVRKASGLGDDNFDRRRRAIFLDFAGFLLDHLTTDLSPAPPPEPPATDAVISLPETTALAAAEPADPEHVVTEVARAPAVAAAPVAVEAPEDANQGRSWRDWLIAVAWAVPTMALLLAASFWLHDNKKKPAAANSSGKTSSPASNGRQSTSGPSPTPTVTFDDLGGGSTIIRVFPGVQNTARDLTANGTFHSGDTVAAVCKTTGRLVASNPAAGELARHTNVWVQVAGTNGLQQYIALTYADMTPAALTRLPTCSDPR